jgi:hypothetical protein
VFVSSSPVVVELAQRLGDGEVAAASAAADVVDVVVAVVVAAADPTERE